MKKNFDNIKKVIQGADGNSGNGGNENPSAQDSDRNSSNNVNRSGTTSTGYQKVAAPHDFDGGSKVSYS